MAHPTTARHGAKLVARRRSEAAGAISGGVPTDINGDNYLDTALKQVYYNDTFGAPGDDRADNRWGIIIVHTSTSLPIDLATAIPLRLAVHGFFIPVFREYRRQLRSVNALSRANW